MYCKPPKRHPKTGGSQLYIWGLSFGYLSLSGKLGIHWCDFPHTFGVPSYGFQICVFFGCFWIDFSRPCWYEFKWHLVVHSLQKNGDGLPCEFWSLGVFFAPYQLVRTTKLCISNLSACNCRILSFQNQLTIRSKRLLTREKHKVEGLGVFRNLPNKI